MVGPNSLAGRQRLESDLNEFRCQHARLESALKESRCRQARLESVKAEATACASGRSCVSSYPTREHQGLVWVWPQSGPAAFIHAAATAPAACPYLDDMDPGECWRGFFFFFFFFCFCLFSNDCAF